MITRRHVLTASALASVALVPGLSGCAEFPGLESLRWQSVPDLVGLAPPAPREFRAAWVATVANIDWPSRKGLTTAQQQAEMRVILDRAVAIGLNAIILQIRTSADALYASALEPWSEYLSGTQGQAPEPFYDPLALWISEAHGRGLELHAWFNPFRARQSDANSANSSSHLSQSHPEWVKSYGNQLWIDPGEQGAADHSLAVFMDVLRRYDVDGIHIDDYFYPYPIPQPAGTSPAATPGNEAKLELDFPDQPSWQRYLDGGGTLTRNDWRRSNVNKLIERIYTGIRQTKPWVRFGISPFGLGRPELRPAGIQGFSQYHKLYADVELWMQQGWFDYLVPQLYWAIDQKAQAFVPLLDYWHRQNTLGRHVFAGLFTSRVPADGVVTKNAWQPREIVDQIAAVRQLDPCSGHVHFSMVALLQNRAGLADTLASVTYRQGALIPASPWLEGGTDLAAPLLSWARGDADTVRLSVREAAGSKPVVRWSLWIRYGSQWRFHVAAIGAPIDIALQGDGPIYQPLTGAVVSAIDRVGNESVRVGWIRIGDPIGGQG